MGPLDHPGLRLIEEQIDRGELPRAQQLLAGLGDSDALRHGTSFLATRLLFERGRLDNHEVAERLRDLLKLASPFPEAEAMLRAVESESLRAGDQPPSDSDPASTPPRPQHEEETRDSIEALFKKMPSVAPSLPSIPKAPGLPHFTPAPDLSPSYSPEKQDSPPPASDAVPTLPFAVTHPNLNEKERALETTRPPTRSIRSGPPPSYDQAAIPSVIDIAALLDEERFEDALRSLDRAQLAGADQQLLRARALHGQGRRDDALAALDPLRQAPLLEPELRGSCARLLLELDEIERALEQSERAHYDEPDSQFLRLTLAWTKLRALRRDGQRRLLEEAEQLLEGIQARDLPLPALVLALRACVNAHGGDPERGALMAQRALSLDPRSVDALWALGLANARLSHRHEAKQAFLRLLNVSLGEARLLRRELTALGAPITDAPRAEGSDFPNSRALWHPLESTLLMGDRSLAAAGVEELCRERLAALSEGASDFPLLAADTAKFFNAAPIWHHFAPFDLSLWSIPRVAAAIDLLYSVEPRGTPTDDAALIRLVSAYVGETLRLTHGGTWQRSPRDDAAIVVCDEQQWRPFDLVLARMRRGLKLAVEESVALSHPGADTWNQRVQPASSPPLPWSPDAWPPLGRIEQLGRGVAESVIGLYCQKLEHSPLDFSFESLRALDRYLALVAPPRAPLDDDPVWARRLAILLGAYLGETLREATGGRWHHERCARVEADAYVVVLADVRTALPIAHVMARVLGETTMSLTAYAQSLVVGLEEG